MNKYFLIYSLSVMFSNEGFTANQVSGHAEEPESGEARATTPMPSSLGFYETTSKQIPEGVRVASKSVFLIATPGGDQGTIKEFFQGHSVDEVIKDYEKKKPGKEESQIDIDVMLYQLRKCKKRESEFRMQNIR